MKRELILIALVAFGVMLVVQVTGLFETSSPQAFAQSPIPTPLFKLEKSTDPDAVPEPGDNVTFTVDVSPIYSSGCWYMTSLSDSVFGDLNGEGTCSVPQSACGETYTCQFSGFVAGNAGDQHINAVSAISRAYDDLGHIDVPVSAVAEVSVSDVLPTISVDNSASPVEVNEPGDEVTFTVSINNNSVATDPVVIDTLNDNLIGNLNGQGNCDLTQAIESGTHYICSFKTFVGGNEGDIVTSIISAAGHDDENNPASDNGSASITILGPDQDKDGLLDDDDVCPLENASGADANTDGCIDEIDDLDKVIVSLALGKGTEKSLVSKAASAQAAIDKGNVGAAVNKLRAFINQVEALRGKKISGTDADLLMAFAQNIIDSLT